MSFNSMQLQSRLSAFAGAGEPMRCLVAFSGGLDSTVLLHALGQVEFTPAAEIVALHIQHDLHADAAEWERHCRDVATGLSVRYESISVQVERDSGTGLEAAARAVRYQALQQQMLPGDWLLSAHHQDDQAETLLLNLLRGSGMAGMAGIGEVQQFGPGFLMRPLLNVPSDDLLAYATDKNLNWMEDPSNIERRFDRNFLRHAILPELRGRWPAASARLAQSAALAAEASALLAQLADDDLQAVGFDDEAGRLEISTLTRLSDARQRNVLRRALKRLKLASAPATRLRQILDELLPARQDAEPLVSWPGVEIRRYREQLYLQPELRASSGAGLMIGIRHNAVDLGELGRLKLVSGSKPGIRMALLEAGLELRFRDGGEEIRPVGHECTHKLKKLLQQKGVVPWMRDRIPLLYAAGQLVAVADLWIEADACETGGDSVEWSGHPALY